MRTNTPSLNAIRAFESAARHQSFARAAHELRVSPSAISQQVSQLEAKLGIPLFSREKQRLRLTDAGDRYRLSLGSALDRIEAATIELHANGEGVRLRIGALPSLASYWLAPKLKKFSAKYPKINIHVVSLDLNFASSNRAPNLDGGQIDVGLFFGDGHWPNLESEKLMDERLIAIASPKLTKANRRDTDKLFEQLPLLQHSTRPESWSEWFRSQKKEAVIPRGSSFEHFHMLVEAAKGGLGIALVPEPFVQREIEMGSLEQVGDYSLVANRAYYVVYEPERKHHRACSVFVNWLKEHSSKE